MNLIPRWSATVVLIALVASVPIAACGVSGSAGAGSKPAAAAGLTASARCAAGARTLSAAGDVLYPEVGNGGYTSVHTATHTVYDAATNRFLPGNHVELTDRATQCLSSLSLDFERFEPGHPRGSPDMQVQSVSIDGTPASFRFVQPTDPDDPKGPGDPDSRARGPRHGQSPTRTPPVRRPVGLSGHVISVVEGCCGRPPTSSADSERADGIDPVAIAAACPGRSGFVTRRQLYVATGYSPGTRTVTEWSPICTTYE
jgi:hypothetical protein